MIFARRAARWLLGGGLGISTGVPFESQWAAAAASQSLVPSGNVYLNRIDTNLYHVYRPLGGYYWLRHALRSSGNGPLNWEESAILESNVFVSPRTTTAGVTYSGGWLDVASSAFDTYPDGVTRYVDVGGTIEISIDGGGDLYVVFAGRNNCNYVKCEIDDDTDACNELPSNGIYRYLDTYRNSTGLSFRRVVKIASGVSSGEHTIRLTVMSDKNASSVGNRYYHCGLLHTATNPQAAQFDPPEWQANTAYLLTQRVRVANRFYNATVAGTTSTTAPTHTSSTATDGTVTWSALPASPYRLNSTNVQQAGSQLEYAYEIQPTGASAKEDVGGLIHGNETLDSATWTVDGVTTALAVGEWANGAQIKLTQAITATHTEVVGSSINNTMLVHTFVPTKTTISHSHAWQTAATVGWFYAHMWPLVHWDAAAYDKYAIDNLASPTGGAFSIDDYYGMSSEYEGESADYVQAGWGDVLGADGYTNVANPFTEDNPQHSVIAILAVQPSSVAAFAGPNTLSASMLMNIAGGTAPGASGVVGKLYFERVNSTGVAVADGDVWSCSATYYMYLAESPTVTFPPA